MSFVKIEKKTTAPIVGTEDEEGRYDVRGFRGYSMVDSYSRPYTVQESSAMDSSLWLGSEEGRMHLTREDVEKLSRMMTPWQRMTPHA